MNAIDNEKLSSVNINPALDRLKNEIIPTLQAAMRSELNNGILQLSNVVQGALLAVQATEDKAAADVRGLLAGLDGWTLDITIPPITIRLTTPKEDINRQCSPLVQWEKK